jgi:hypothetical protein
MVVTTQRGKRDGTGLHIGAANVRRSFREGTTAIELMLDHLCIQCTLSPDFWEGRPEIHDPRLSEWLEFKAAQGRTGRAPMELVMVRSGIDTFVIRPKSERKQTAFGEETLWIDEVESSRLAPRSIQVLKSRYIA